MQGQVLLHTTKDAPSPETPESSLERILANGPGTAVTSHLKKGWGERVATTDIWEQWNPKLAP